MENRLLQFTSPIVETALKTGARGETTTVTNYGVIGDAMFKKANLDLGIANLQSDFALGSARLKSDLNMQAAGMKFDQARAYMNQNMQIQEMKMHMAENEVGFFEGLLNVAAGAAGAASIALTAGASTPLVIGAAGAGGLMTAGAQAQGGRRGAQGALSAIGTIGNAATMIKGIGQEKAGKDAWSTWTERLGVLQGIIGNPAHSREAQGAAQAELNQHMMQGQNILQNDLGYNPQVAAETMQRIGAISGGGGGGGSRGTGGGKANWEDSIMQLGMAAAGDPRLKDPATRRATLKEYMAKGEAAYASQFNGKEMSESQQQYFMDATGISQLPGISEITNGGKKRMAPRSAAQAQPEHIDTGSLARDVQQNGRVNAREGRQIRQPAPQYRTNDGLVIEPIIGQQAGVVRGQGPGVIMDEPPITSPEAVAPLQKLGAESAKMLQEEEERLEKEKEPEGLGDKLSALTPWTKTDKRERNEARSKAQWEIDKEQAKQEKANQKIAGAPEEVARDEAIFNSRIARAQEERAALNPGVKENRNRERQRLDEASVKLDDLPEKDMTQRNRKQGLKDAVAASQHLDEVMEKIPDDLMTRFTEFVEAEGIGIKSPHVSVELLDEVGKVMSDEAAQAKFTKQELDLLDEYRMELYNLSYADALMDAGSHGVKMEQLKMSKPNMPNFSDDYRKRSNKLRLLMRGYGERIRDATTGENVARESEKLDLEHKRIRNAKARRGAIQKQAEDENLGKQKRYYFD